MKKFPNSIVFSKSHKKKTFKGLKSQKLFTFTTGLRIKKSAYLTFDHFESMRKVLVRCFRPKGPKETKNQAMLQSRQQKPIQKIKSNQKKNAQKPFIKKKKKVTPFRLRHHIYSPITKKPLQVRMGKGKGNVDTWVSPTPFSKTTLEISRKKMDLRKLKRIAKQASLMLPGSSKLVFSRKFLRKEHFFFSSKKKNVSSKLVNSFDFRLSK